MARKKKKVNLAAKCREANMPYGVVHARINTLGWDVDKAITTPVRERGTTATSVVKNPDVQSSTTATAEVVNNVNQRLVGIGIAVAIAVLVIGYFNV